ncbi:MAG: hypothetical protein CML29_03895 [Rhizobiales bacterium]|mgnify:FL=1|nr:hypothetical protein [Hyphomicrobiales bacterium]MBA70493.1 hypothetical protein [Hyphomicrobiales bacterium]|tara:strand:+ start:950 stop:1423 length:474 start_codon:yes stop_codon:yes gene_type:complete
MKNATVKNTIRNVIAGTFVLGAVLSVTNSASAFQIENENAVQAPETVLAYADPNFDARFGNTPEADESVDHELNDAWLGMNVTSENGEVLGYVVDALIGPDGEVTDLVITDDPNSEVEVFVPARLATLTDTDVQLALNSNDVAALRTAYNAVLASSE